MKILKSIVYVISQLFFWGAREIAEGGGEILAKVFAKLWEKFLGSKFHQNCNTTNTHLYICIGPIDIPTLLIITLTAATTTNHPLPPPPPLPPISFVLAPW